MKKLKWILVVLALASVVVITLPMNGLIYSACTHEYVTDACKVVRCSKCEKTKSSNASHTWKKVDCSEKYCTVCGIQSPAKHTFYGLPCDKEFTCVDCGYVECNENIRHSFNYSTRIMRDSCRYYIHCTFCKDFIEEGEYHEWFCSADYQTPYCKYCGMDAPEGTGHSYNYSLFCFFGVCEDCGYVMFQIPSFRYVAAFVGLLMSIVAFVFIFCNRKRIRVEGGKYIRTATPEAHLKEEEIF